MKKKVQVIGIIDMCFGIKTVRVTEGEYNVQFCWPKHNKGMIPELKKEEKPRFKM